MPSQQRLYNGLARPADYSIFARELTCPPVGECLPAGESMFAQGWTCPHGQRAGYGHRGWCTAIVAWPMASAARPQGEPMLSRDIHRDGGSNGTDRMKT